MAELHVWMDGRHVAVWTTLRTGTSVLRYDEAWVRSDEGRALSLSLPFTVGLEHRGAAVTNYFDNLLPDSIGIRRRLRRRFRARSDDAFDLLTAIGRDCVGAVQLLPPGVEPTGWNRVDAEPLKDADVDRILASVTSDMPPGRGHFPCRRCSRNAGSRWRGRNWRYATGQLVFALSIVPDRTPAQADRRHCSRQPAVGRRLAFPGADAALLMPIKRSPCGRVIWTCLGAVREGKVPCRDLSFDS